MSDTVNLLNLFCSEWLDTMVSVLWQSTLLILAVALVLHACQWLPPAIRCWAWRLVALKLLLMPFWVIGVPILTQPPIQPVAPTPSSEKLASFVEAPAAELPDDIQALEVAEFESRTASPDQATEPAAPFAWQSMVAVAYATVVSLHLGRLIWQRLHLGQMLRTTEPAPSVLTDLVAECSQELGLRRPPETRFAKAEISPFVCRIVRPLLVLPCSLTSDAAVPQLRPIVLHELAHIRRRDLTWRLALEITRVLWWFHPLAHWVAYRESLERELACDQLAMLHAKFSAADYARTLVDAASRMAFPSVLRAAAAAHFDGGQPLTASASQRAVTHLLRSLEP